MCTVFDVEKHKKIFSLSLGNKKKVGIIQSLIHKPRLLIMDEPTSCLDPLVKNRFFEILGETTKNGCAIFFSSHVLSEVQRICHRVGFIKAGKIIKVDSMENLKNRTVKKVKLELNHINEQINIPGARDVKSAGKIIEFIYTGDNRIPVVKTDYQKQNDNRYKPGFIFSRHTGRFLGQI